MRFNMRFKRSLAAICVFLFTGVFLAGCSLFVRDIETFNNRIVATVGDNITIRKRELVEAYQRVGPQFIQQGMSQQEAVEATLDLLIEREIMVHLSHQDEWFGAHGYGLPINGVLPLTEREWSTVRTRVFDSFDRIISNRANAIREERGLSVIMLEDETPQGGTVFEGYTPIIRTEMIAGQRTFELPLDRFIQDNFVAEVRTFVQPGTAVIPNTDYLHVVEVNSWTRLENAFMPIDNTPSEIDVMRSTRARIVQQLENAEIGLNFPEDRNEAFAGNNILRRELNRMLESEQQNILTQRFRDMHEQGIMDAGIFREGITYFELFANRHNDEASLETWQNEIARINQDFVNRQVEAVRNQYFHNIRSAIDRMNKGLETEASIRQNLLDPQSGLRNVWWLPHNIAREYFTVSHILIGFEDRNAIANLNARLQTGEINRTEYDREVQRLRGELRVRQRDENGIEFGLELSPADVLAIVQRNVSSHNPHRGFRDMIYAFNTDPGMENPEFEYIIGIDKREICLTTGNRLHDGSQTGDRMSGMVPEFTAEARRLQATGQRGALSDRLIWSQFGAHIIMYTREITDFIFTNDESRLSATYHHFLYAPQTSYGEKLFFDAILETLPARNFSEAEANVISTFKSQRENGVLVNPITIHHRNIRDMWR